MEAWAANHYDCRRDLPPARVNGIPVAVYMFSQCWTVLPLLILMGWVAAAAVPDAPRGDEAFRLVPVHPLAKILTNEVPPSPAG